MTSSGVGVGAAAVGVVAVDVAEDLGVAVDGGVAVEVGVGVAVDEGFWLAVLGSPSSGAQAYNKSPAPSRPARRVVPGFVVMIGDGQESRLQIRACDGKDPCRRSGGQIG